MRHRLVGVGDTRVVLRTVAGIENDDNENGF